MFEKFKDKLPKKQEEPQRQTVSVNPEEIKPEDQEDVSDEPIPVEPAPEPTQAEPEQEKQIVKVQQPVFLSSADKDRLVWNTHLMVSEIYAKLQEES